VSRSWLAIRGPRARRSVRISFWLARPTAVVVRVDQVAPDCRYAGKFLVRGHAGRNVVRFRGRLRGRTLQPGTYRVVAHPRGQRAYRLERATVVVLERPPGGAAEVRAASTRNVCPSGLSPSQVEFTAVPVSKDTQAGNGKGVAGATARSGRGGLLDAEGPIGKPLGQAAGTIENAARSIPPALFAMVALAVLLLALASMPQIGGPSRASALLVHRRASITVAGGAALATAIATYLVLLKL
jgi:hypothetical protein